MIIKLNLTFELKKSPKPKKEKPPKGKAPAANPNVSLIVNQTQQQVK